MRVGDNPNKVLKIEVEEPARITVGVLNCIQSMDGYFAAALPVLELCIASIRANAGEAIDLLLVDNGSCEPVRKQLHEMMERGDIDYLVLNHRNIGKGNALLQILRGAPGDVVVYTDGDVFFRPGWLQAHVAVLEAFPEAGMVGGVPLRHTSKRNTDATKRWLDGKPDGVTLEKGRFIDEAGIREHAASCGIGPDDPQLASWLEGEEWRVVRNGVPCYVGMSHMQFAMPRAAIARLPHNRYRRLVGVEREFPDRVVDDLGLLRISTTKPFVYHMGNTLSEDWLRAEYERLVGKRQAPSGAPPRTVDHWIWKQQTVRRALRKIYMWSYDRYTQSIR